VKVSGDGWTWRETAVREEERANFAEADALRVTEEFRDFKARLLRDSALRGLDSVIAPIWDEDDAPALPDYRRAMEAAITVAELPESN